MSNNTKANDWVVAIVDNPTFGLQNFKDVGLSPDNTVLQDKNTYRNSQYIQDKFQDNTGKFDETAFNKFYSNAASLYQAFANNQFEDDILSDVSFDPFDALRPKGAEDKTKSPFFDVVRVQNPDRLKTGISRVGRTDEREWTVSELAQKERVFDYATKQWKDYTPNDRTLFGNFGGFLSSLSEPLVIAQWEEEGYHMDPGTGRRVKHKKGDYKYNEDGNYYYETLSGREAYGKQFKSVFDSFTVDGSKANKYDFFDSDSLDKSVTGTVMKTVATLAPLFIPGVGGYYGAALVGANLLDILPNVYKASIGLLSDNETPFLNNIQGIGKSLKGSKSEYSKNHLVSTENFFDLITDVSLQWAQQRAIFSAFNKLARTGKMEQAAAEAADQQVTRAIASDLSKGTLRDPKALSEMAMQIQTNKLKPLLEANNRMAADAALGYMATMQGIDVFESALEQGADKVEAAAITWGSIAGMFVWDRTGIGEIFFPELKGDQQAFRRAINSVGDEIAKGFDTTLAAARTEGRKKGLAKLFQKAKEKSSDFWKQVNEHSLTFTGKALGEGIEEVGEEFIMDFAKSTYNWAQEFGWTKTNVHLDAWENIAERYGMSFFGGAIGGAVFAGVDIVQNQRNPEQLNQELVYLIRNGRTNEMLEELDKMRDKNKLGNKNLSASKYEMDSKEPNKRNWLSPTSADDNQNQATYNMVKNYIQSLDTVIHQEGLAYSDDELLDKMFMGDQRMKSLISFGKTSDEEFGPLMANGYNGRLLQDWNTLSSDILKVEQELRALEKGIIDGKKEYADDAALSKAKSDNTSLYNVAKNRLLNGDGKFEGKMQLLEKRDKFLNGQYSQHYVDQMLFAIDNNVNKFFFNPTFKDYVESQTQKQYTDVAPDQLTQLKTDYDAFVSGPKMNALDTAYKIYKDLNKKGSLQVGAHGEKYEQFLQVRDLVRQQLVDLDLTNEKLESVRSGDMETIESIFNQIPGKNSISPELKEQFKLVSTNVDPNLSPEDQIMQRGVAEAINEEVIRNISSIVDQFKQIGFIDPQTKKLLLKAIKSPLPQELTSASLKEFTDQGIAPIDDSSPLYTSVRNILNGLTPQNAAEIKSQIQDFMGSDEVRQWASDAVMDLEDLGMDYDDEGNKITVDDQLGKLKWYSEFVDQMIDAFNSDRTIQLTQQLESDIISISDNPIYELLGQFSVNTFGKPVGVFEVLEQENTRLGNTQTLSEYVLDPTAQQQIEQGLTVVDMTESIINASSTHEFNSDDPYGHNQTMNYFLETYFPQEEKYGIVRQDLAEKMKEDLNQVRSQLLFLKELSRINSVNQFSKHKLTGKVITKLMSDILRGKGQYGFLKDLQYDGHKLFDGIDSVITSALDSDEATDEMYVQSDQLQDVIYNNFEKIVDETGTSREKVFEGLFHNLKQKFSEDSLMNQRNSQFDPQTKNLEDYDVFLWLTTLMTLKRSDYNYYLREALKDENVKFAPLFAQEHTAQMAVAYMVDPSLFNKAIDLIAAEKGQIGEDLVSLKNLIMVNGIGGAGKTSVVAKIVDMLREKLFPESTIWKIGPTKEQAKNLTVSLGKGKEFDIDQAMQQILGEQEYGELQADIRNGAETSKYYTVDKYEQPGMETAKVARATKVDYGNKDIPKVVYLDEATHVNSVVLQHLSNWAVDNKVLLVAMGDLIQNGYEEHQKGFGNIGPESTLAVRTPKLKISMRINNIQKDDNVKTTLAVLDFIERDLNEFAKTFSQLDPSQMESEKIKKAAEYLQFIKDTQKFRRFTDDDHPINGEQLVGSVDQGTIEKLLQKGDLGVVYDDQNSAVYSTIKKYVEDHPEAKDKISFFTPKQVQGSERSFFIIDTHYNQSQIAGDPTAALDFMKDLYTMHTRSKVGTLFVDNGLSNIIPKDNWSADDYTEVTPNPEQIIKDFRENKLEILDATLGDYTPSLMPVDDAEVIEEDEDTDEEDTSTPSESQEEIQQGQPAQEESEPTNNPPTNNPPANIPSEAEERSSKITQEPVQTPPVKPSTEDLSQDVQDNIPTKSQDDGIKQEFLDRVEKNDKKENPEPLNADAPPVLTGIRAYGWYMRYGANIAQKQHGTTTYNSITYRENPEQGVVDDLNVFLDPDFEYTDAEISKWSVRPDQLNSIHNAAEMLKSVRNYLTFGQEFDEDFINLIKKRSSKKDKVLPLFATFGRDEKYALQVWNSGSFKLQVRKNDETLDRAIDKQGYDLSKVEPVAFNLIYEITLGKSHFQFTIGKLPKPETWKTYIDSDAGKADIGSNMDKVVKSYRAYEKWYRDLSQQIMGSDTYMVKYFDVPKETINFQGATRMVAVPDGDGKKLFNLNEFEHDHPNAVRSPLYIYAGSKGDIGNVKDSVKGKAIVFVAANKDVKIDGEKITSENIADLYIRQQKTGGTPVIRMMIVNPKGKFVFSSSKAQGKIEGFLDMNLKQINEENNEINKYDAKEARKKLATVGSNTTAARMIVSIWNYRAGLIRMAELIEKNEGKTEKEINDIIEHDNKLRELEFRLRTPSSTEYGIGLKSNGLEGEKARQLVDITKAWILSQKQFLDSLVELMSQIVTLPEEGRYPITTDKSKFRNDRFNYTDIVKDLANGKGSIVLDTPDGKLKTAPFGKNGAVKVATLLAAVSRIFSDSKNAWKASNYTLHTTDKNGDKKAFDLTELAIVIGQALTDNGLKSQVKASTFVRNTLNMIFHGKINPYIEEYKTHRSFAPFPKGILYHAKYDYQDKSSPLADFYPCRNIDDEFTYDVTIENSNLEIDIDLTKLKESAPREVVEQVNREAMNLQVDNFATQIQRLNLPFTDDVLIDIQQSGVRDSQSQADLDAKLNDLYTKVVNRLNDAVAKGRVQRNGDPVLKAELTRDDLGNIDMKYSTLTDKLRQKKIGSIPTAADGLTDYSQIASIDYNIGNDGSFVVTLQNGDTIKGNIVGDDIVVLDQDINSVVVTGEGEVEVTIIRLGKDEAELIDDTTEVLSKIDPSTVDQDLQEDFTLVSNLVQHLAQQEGKLDPNINSVEILSNIIAQAEVVAWNLIDIDPIMEELAEQFNNWVTNGITTMNVKCKI